MKRRLSALLVFLLTLLPHAVMAGPAETLLIASDGDFRPLTYLEGGHPAGALCDILAEAARRANIPIEIRFMPWARGMAEVRAGRVDALFPVIKTADRESYLAFPSEVLLSTTISLFVRADSPITYDGDIHSIADRKIGIANQVSSGPAMDRAVQSGLLTHVQIVASTTKMVKMLTTGRIDMIPAYNRGIWADAKTLGLEDEIKELSPPLDVLPAYLAFSRSRDMSAEIQALDATLKSMKDDGSYQKMLDAYYVTKTP
jgi:polar amino acid transport system substrate-binding protein